MSEEDEFGELYSDLGPGSIALLGTGLPGIGPRHELYEDDGGEEETSPFGSAQLEKELVRKPPNGVMLGDGFSDEEQDLPAGVEAEDNRLGYSLISKSELGRTENRSSNSPRVVIESRVVETLQQLQESLESEEPDKVVTDGAGSLELGNAGAPLVQDVRETLDISLPSTFTSSISGKSPDAEDLTNQAAAIPGLSTSSNVAQFAVEDELHEGWEGRDGVGQGVGLERIQSFGGEDFDSDSEDDLHIVLNDGLPFYQSFERGADRGSEDEHDFVVLAGNEAVDEQEWGEELLLPLDGFQGDKSLPAGGVKQGVPGDERVQSGKGAGLQHQGGSRIGYGGHAYHNSHHQYRYVRPGALGGGGATSGAQGLSNRVPQSKGGNGRGDWSGSSRGFPSSQKIPIAPWGNSGPRGFQYGFEYNLPPNKTVFEIDLDSLDEKPWRHPSVDISDYFNFGFNESSWKDYCKQLAQLRLESTMQSKIRVYESGRLEQEFDSDLPPELAVAAGTCGISGDAAHCQMGTTIVTGTGGGVGRGAGRGHMQGISTGRAIQVEGGVGERRPSADVRRQRIRDSDAIIVIDATVDASFKEQCSDDDFLVEKVEVTKDSPDLQLKKRSKMCGKGGPPLQSRVIKAKKERLASGSNSQECGVRSRSVLVGDKVVAGSDIGIAQSNTGLEFNLFQGESFSPPCTTRHKTPRPSTPPGRTPIQEKRETDREKSHSSSMHDESQPVQEGQNNAGSLTNNTEREENSEVSDSGGRCGDEQRDHDVFRVLVHSKRNKSSTQEGTVQGDAVDIIRHRSKRRRADSSNETHAIWRTKYDQRKSAKEFAPRMVLNSHEHSNKVGLEHADAEYVQHKRQYIAHGEDEHFLDENAQSDWRNRSVGPGGEKVNRQMISHASKVNEERTKVKDRVELIKVKNQVQDRRTRGADAQCSKKGKEEGAKRAYPLKEKAKHRIRGQPSNLVDMKRLEDGNGRGRIDRDQGIRDKPTNSLVSEGEIYPGRADEGMHRSRDKGDLGNGSHEHPEKLKVAVDCGEREQETCRRREQVSRRNKSGNYQHRKGREELLPERVSAHQLKGLHNVKREKGLARHMEAGRRRRMSGDKTLLVQSRDETNVRDSTKVTSGDHEHLREMQNQPGVQEPVRNRMEDCLENEGQAKHHHDEEGSGFQKSIMHQAKGLQGQAFNKRKKSFVNARSVNEKRRRKRPKMDVSKATDVKNERNDASFTLVDERNNDNRGHKDTSKEHGTTNNQSTNHFGMVLSGKSSDAVNSRLEQAERLGGHGGIGLEIVRAQENDMEAQLCTAKEESAHGVLSGTSQDEPKQRGRSKLERWTNQKAVEEDASDRVMVNDKKLTKKERRRGKRRNATSRGSQDNVLTSGSGQLLNRVDSSVLQATKAVDKELNAAREMPDRTEGNEDCSRNWNGKVKVLNQDAASKILPARVNEQQNVQQPMKIQQLELAAKLERRKERFKLPMLEEKDLIQRLASDSHQLLDQQEVKPERPARKRRWGSS